MNKTDIRHRGRAALIIHQLCALSTATLPRRPPFPALAGRAGGLARNFAKQRATASEGLCEVRSRFGAELLDMSRDKISRCRQRRTRPCIKRKDGAPRFVVVSARPKA